MGSLIFACESKGCQERIRVSGPGPVARFCSTRCRVAAHRARRAVPTEMTSRRRWVRRTAAKAPLSAGFGRPASSTDPSTWATYAAASRSKHGVGLGYVLAEGDGIVCIDLDHCVIGGRVADWAQAVLDAAPPTFAEISASGTGLHLWGRGHVGRGRKIRRGDGTAVEIYDRGRYIALGERLTGAPTKLADLTGVIASLT